MALYTINFYTLDQFLPSRPFTDTVNGGLLVGETVEVLSTNVTRLTVEDTAGTNFADNQLSQYIRQDVVNDGTTYASGTAIQPEYQLTMEDGFGNTYTALIISTTSNNYDQFGMTFIGDVPNPGDTLTITGYSPIPSVSYSAICLDARTPVLTAQGPRPVGELRVGQLVATRDHGLQPIRLVLTQRHRFDGAAQRHRPIELRRQSGPGPVQRARVSPQHRVLVQGDDGSELLIPAKALAEAGLARICSGARQATYINLVFDRHEIIWAGSSAVESFWPGPVALAQLDLTTVIEIGRIMGAAPVPARPFRRKLTASRELARAV